jgi:DNA-binding response OmpR family regulator
MSRVLLIDDEPSVLMLLEVTFKQRGWDVVKAATGEEGLSEFNRTTPDVMLVDKNLPGISGVDVIREVRKQNDEVGILLITGYASAESARDTLNLGVDEYVEKPFDDVLLLAGLVERVMARARQRVSATGSSGARKLHVVVASADEARRGQIVGALPRGDRMSSVSSSDDLLTHLTLEPADLLVLDGTSYRTEVTQLTATLRHKFPQVPVVVMSKRLTLSDIQKLIQMQVTGLVDNPIESPAFGSTLVAAVERVRRQRR